MLQLSGRLKAVKEEPRHDRNGAPFTVVTFVVECWGGTFYVDKAREFSGNVPDEGAEVTLEVAPRPYLKKTGEPAVGWMARAFIAPGARAA